MNCLIKIKSSTQEIVLKGVNYDNILPAILKDIIILKENLFNEKTYVFKHNAFYFKDYEVCYYNISDDKCNIIVDLDKNLMESDYMLDIYQSFHECQEYFNPIINIDNKYYITSSYTTSLKEVKELSENDYHILMNINNKTIITFKEMIDFANRLNKYSQSDTDTYYYQNVIVHFNFI